CLLLDLLQNSGHPSPQLTLGSLRSAGGTAPWQPIATGATPKRLRSQWSPAKEGHWANRRRTKPSRRHSPQRSQYLGARTTSADRLAATEVQRFVHPPLRAAKSKVQQFRPASTRL